MKDITVALELTVNEDLSVEDIRKFVENAVGEKVRRERAESYCDVLIDAVAIKDSPFCSQDDEDLNVYETMGWTYYGLRQECEWLQHI